MVDLIHKVFEVRAKQYIRLVKHKHFYVPGAEVPLLNHLEENARCPRNNVHTCLKYTLMP